MRYFTSSNKQRKCLLCGELFNSLSKTNCRCPDCTDKTSKIRPRNQAWLKVELSAMGGDLW